MHLNPSSFVRISFTQSTHSVMQGDSNKHNAIWSCLQLETFFTQLWEKKVSEYHTGYSETFISLQKVQIIKNNFCIYVCFFDH